MKYALFLGCTVPVRGTHYELAARKVAGVTGIEFADIADFACCGFPIKAFNTHTAFLVGARNLALASRQKLPICTLCSSCTSTLTEIAKALNTNPAARLKTNRELAAIDRHIDGEVIVRHFARILYEQVGLDRIRSLIKRPLASLKLAVHSGCHYLKPSGIFEAFDDPEIPHTVRAMLEATGASVVDYFEETKCCGGATMGIEEMTGLGIAKRKLDSLRSADADALVVICPFCDIMYEANQRKIEQAFNTTYELPILYFPQVLGLAFGFDRRELGFQFNTVKPDKILQEIGA
jgi:heterodisulfide reductase subunit B